MGFHLCLDNANIVKLFPITKKMCFWNVFFFIARQKLTSPKWNRFRGIRLRWKDKIRLNNVIWRCWHMQCRFFPLTLWDILISYNFSHQKNKYTHMSICFTFGRWHSQQAWGNLINIVRNFTHVCFLGDCSWRQILETKAGSCDSRI